MTELELAILDGVRDRHEHDEEDQRLRQREKAGAKERHIDVRAAQRVDHKRYDHDGNRGEEELAAAELRREHRKRCNGEQADDRVDDAEPGELRSVADDIDEIIEVEVIDDVDADAVDEIGDGRPEQLVVLRENFEHILRRGIRLVLAQRRVLFLRADAEDDGAERCDAAADAGKREPACRIARTAVLIDGEIEHDRHDDDRHEIRAEHRADTRDRRRDLTLMGVKGQRRNHGPDGDILRTVKDIHDKVNDCEKNQIKCRIRDRQPAEIREEQRERDSGDKGANEHPGLEAPPARLRLVDDVADERVDEKLRDAQDEDDRRDDADHILVMTRVAGVEEVARDENHEIRREHRVKHIMAERAACVSDARPNLSPAV